MIQVQLRTGGTDYTLTAEYVGHATNALRYICYVSTSADREVVLETMVGFSSQWAIVEKGAGRIPKDPAAFKDKLEELAAAKVARSLREGKRPSAIFIDA